MPHLEPTFAIEESYVDDNGVRRITKARFIEISLCGGDGAENPNDNIRLIDMETGERWVLDKSDSP